MSLAERITELVERYYPHIRDIRRQIHMYPELKHQEHKTAALVAEELDKLGFVVKTNYTDIPSVVAYIDGDREGPVRAFRADMDALPLEEQTDLPYASKNKGIMHACGHDFHTAILVGVGYVLKELKNELKGRVVLVFQPAEEGGFGGKVLAESGFIEDLGIEYIIAGHLFPDIPFGKIGYRYGYMMANSDRFNVYVKGHGGHGARPEKTIDPIAVSCCLVNALYTMRSREVSAFDPVVITVGSIQAGTVGTIIPQESTIRGTLRTLNEETRKRLFKRIKDVSVGVAKSFGAEAEVEIKEGYPAVKNSDFIVDKIKEAGILYLGKENVVEIEHPSMGGEDFAYYLKKIPGAFYRLGVGPSYPLHNPKFAPKEEVIKIGMGLKSFIALNCC